MRRGGQNAKGSSFERLICRKLTAPIMGKPVPEIFWRSATSGAKATVDHAAGRGSFMGGDLVSVHPAGDRFIRTYSVECKDRKTYGQLESLIERKGPLFNWWGQCVRDAELSGRHPLLIFKALRTPIYVIYTIKHHVIPGKAERFLCFVCPIQKINVGISFLDEWIAANSCDGSPLGSYKKLRKVGI